MTTNRVLLISSRLTNGREHALRNLFQLDGRLDVRAPGTLPDLVAYGAVVLDGAQGGLTAAATERLRSFVARGGALLAIGAAPADVRDPLAQLLGVAAGAALPPAELFGKNLHPEHELLQRVDPEFLVVDSFSPLDPLPGEASTLISIQWAFRERVAAFERRIEQGRIVVTSLGNSTEALESRALATLLRRATRPAAAAGKRSFGVGVIGYGPQGGMGYLHGTAVSSVTGLSLVAVCDRAPDRLQAAQTDFPSVHCYFDAQGVIDDPDVDVAIIATPPVAHAGIALALLQAGKHVVCEKPLCLTVKDADTLLQAAEATGAMLTVNHNRRWDPDYLAISSLVSQGRLGELFNVETFAGDFAHPCRFWHSDETISGGAVYDWGAHHIDWILQLMPGMPSSVTAHSHKRVWHDVTNADQVRVRLNWPDGREAEFFYSDIAAVRRPKFYIQGTQGTLVGHYRPVAFERLEPARGYVREEAHYAEAPADLVLGRYESGYGISETRIPLPAAPHFALHRNLADHLLMGEPLTVTAQSARQVVAVLEAATSSAQQGGRPVTPEV